MVISTLRIVTAAKSRLQIVRTLIGQLGPLRVQSGCLRCDLYHDIENREIVTLVEEWESQAKLDVRLRSDEYRAVLETIELAQEQPIIRFDTVTRSGGRRPSPPPEGSAAATRAGAGGVVAGRYSSGQDLP